MRNFKRRLERLERLTAIQPQDIPCFLVHEGDTPEEVWKRYLADHPEYKEVDFRTLLERRHFLQIRSAAPPSIPIKKRPGR